MFLKALQLLIQVNKCVLDHIFQINYCKQKEKKKIKRINSMLVRKHFLKSLFLCFHISKISSSIDALRCKFPLPSEKGVACL